jgi:hypothetical protein
MELVGKDQIEPKADANFTIVAGAGKTILL